MPKGEERGGAVGPAAGEGRRFPLGRLLDEADDAVLFTEGWPIDGPGPRVLYANAAFSRTTGYSYEEIVGKSPRVLQGPGTDRAALDGIRAALEAGRSVRTELLNYRKDGEAYWVDLSIAPVRDGAGRIERWLSVQRETTARVEAEEAGLEAERRLRSVLARYGSDMVTILEPDGTPRYESPAVERALGYRHKELAEDDVFRFVHPDDVEGIARSVAEAVRTPGESPPVEFRMRHADGSWRWFESSKNNLSGDPDVGGIVVVTRDVTERRRTGEALRLSEESLAQAQRIAHIGNWEHDPGKNRTRWSDEMYRIFGFAAGGLNPSYRAFMLFVHPEDRQRVRGSIRAATDGGGPQEIGYRIVRPNGEVRFIHTQYEAVHDEAGRPVTFFGTVQDVTEREEAERKLEEAEEKYRHLVEQIPAVAYIDRADVPDVAFYTSPRIEALLGYTPQEWLGGRLWLERLHPDDRGWVLEADTRARAAQEPFGEEYRLIARDGRVVWVRDESALLRDEEGRPLSWQGILLDITERKRAEAALRESEERFQALTDAAFEGIIIHEGGLVLEANEVYAAMHGREVSEIVGRSALEWAAPEYRTLVRRHILSGYEEPYESVETKKDGTRVDVEVRGRSLSYRGRTVRVAAVRDITERKRAEDALKESEERYRAVVEQSTEAIWLFDPETKGVLEANAAFRGLLGYSEEDLRRMTNYDFVAHSREDVDATVARKVDEGEYGAADGRKYRRKDGTLVDVEVRGAAISYRGREAVCSVARDVSGRKRMEEELRRRATHDPLTGLPNRRLLMERLRHALGRRGREVALLFLDLDGFKVVNDSLGHGAGDRLLVAAAGRLQGAVRPSDTVARLGGDEFVVLVEDADREGAARAADRILAALGAPFAVDGHDLRASASVGIALGGPGRPVGPDELLRRADLAMYRAKEGGKARHAFYDPSMDDRARARLELESGLPRALQRGEFSLRYQPVVSVGNGDVVGLEALLRWEHPRRGTLRPAEFLAEAEEAGLAGPLFAFALGGACRLAARLENGEGSPWVSANLSPSRLRDPGLTEEVARALSGAGVAPGSLVLEVTEDAAVEGGGEAEAALGRIRGLGVRVAMDDFGTGHSSLSGLERLPADLLKLDRAFVANLAEDRRKAAVVRGTADLARALGLAVVAEGVETEAQLEVLRGVGCDLAQGYLFAGPLAAGEAASLVARGR